jgi:hypothetical protein
MESWPFLVTVTFPATVAASECAGALALVAAALTRQQAAVVSGRPYLIAGLAIFASLDGEAECGIHIDPRAMDAETLELKWPAVMRELEDQRAYLMRVQTTMAPLKDFSNIPRTLPPLRM